MSDASTPETLFQELLFQYLSASTFSTLVASSQDRGWEGVDVVVFELVAVEDDSVIPEIASAHDSLTLTLEGKVDLRRRLGGHWVKERTGTGSLAIAPKDVPILYRWEAPSLNVGIYPRPSLLATIVEQIGQGDPCHVEMLPVLNFFDPLLEQIGRAWAAELQSESLGGRLYAESLAHTFCIHMLRNYSTLQPVLQSPRGKLDASHLRKVKDYIETHLAENIGLSELAAVAGLSPSHFARLFKQSTGHAPHQYVTLRRVERARELLSMTPLTVAHVAQQVGFFDQSHLIRHFKRIYGFAPQVVRHD